MENVILTNMEKIHFFDSVIVGEYRYFSSINYNGLLKQKISEDRAEFIGCFENEDKDAIRMHIKVIHIKDELYFVPFNGRNLSIFNIVTEEFDYIELAEGKKVSFAKAFVSEGKMILIPSNNNTSFMEFVLKDKKIKKLKDIWKTIKQVSGKENLNIDIYSSNLIGKNLTLSAYGENILFDFNIENSEYEYFEFPERYELKNFKIIDNKFWYTLVNSYNIISYDPESKEIREYFSEVSGEKTDPYMQCIKFNGKIYILPCAEDSFGMIDEKNEKIVIVKKLVDEKYKRRNTVSSLVIGYEVNEESIIIYPNAADGILKIEANMTVSVSDLFINKSIERLIKIIIDSKLKDAFHRGLIVEDSEIYYTLDNYVKYICDAEETIKVEQVSEIGKNIWDEVKKDILQL